MGGRSGTPADLLLVGLGNPGPEFERTRHNLGAEFVTRVANDAGVRLKAGKEKALVAEGQRTGRRVAFAVPTTYMNLSGEAVRLLVRRFGIEDLEDLVIVHDELDLPVGTCRIKSGGGLAGHNGLKSIKEHLHTDMFTRIRIGIGRPSRGTASDYVLKPPSKADRSNIEESLAAAERALDLILTEGVESAMNHTNGQNSPLGSEGRQN